MILNLIQFSCCLFSIKFSLNQNGSAPLTFLDIVVYVIAADQARIMGHPVCPAKMNFH